MTPMTFTDPRLAKLDGFRVEIDAARERADVILDRPPLNVISMPQRDQLRLVFEALDENDTVRIVVLRSIGEHFSSGGNIAGFLEATPETVSKLAWNIAAPARCSKPVIAANRGYCFGVGFEISLACDFRIATDCVADAKLEATTDALVDELRAFSPLAQRTAKKLLNDTEDAMLSTAIELEGHCYSRLRQSDDFREGVEAFHAKRPAKFTGT